MTDPTLETVRREALPSGFTPVGPEFYRGIRVVGDQDSPPFEFGPDGMAAKRERSPQ